MRAVYKISAFIVTILSVVALAISMIAAIAMIKEGIYTTTEENYRKDAYKTIVDDMSYGWMISLNDGAEQYVLSKMDRSNIAKVVITSDRDTERSVWQYDSDEPFREEMYTREFYYGVYQNEIGETEKWIFSSESEIYDMQGLKVLSAGKLSMEIYLTEKFTQYDDLYFAEKIITPMYKMRYAVYGIGIGAFLLAVIGFVFLMYISGKKYGEKEVQPGWGTKFPFDVLTVGLVMIGILYVISLSEMPYWWSNAIVILVAACIGGVGMCVLILGWFMSLALRMKLRVLWKNTLIYFILHWSVKILRKIPLVWKSVLIFGGVSLAELIILLCNLWEGDNLLIWWFFEKFCLFPVLLYAALSLRKLKMGGEALAAGDLNAKVDTEGLVFDLKEHGENLNQIREGMTLAVEQRMKSERMKTELITNVSHDIKTPLTSIINYTDLIEKEPCDNVKIREYAQVLHRHSERLKRLIEDLVEASKASTGNLEVKLAPCEVGVLLSQSVGEYSERLEASGLTLVVNQPERALFIRADGRRLWRVFDNLLGNICKYAQEGTRVYLSLEVVKEQVIISFKNTSREALNISADELMERFVQGDHSRKSDGNGLGLSIARSLTELQNGTMELSVDGDLFKVVLCFPYCKDCCEKLK